MAEQHMLVAISIAQDIKRQPLAALTSCDKMQQQQQQLQQAKSMSLPAAVTTEQGMLVAISVAQVIQHNPHSH
jgi:hypothetical protein